MPEKWPFLATLRMYSQPTACDRLVSAIDEFVNDANETERTLIWLLVSHWAPSLALTFVERGSLYPAGIEKLPPQSVQR